MGYLYQVGKTYYYGVKKGRRWIRRSTHTQYKEAAKVQMQEAELRLAQGRPLEDPPKQTFAAFAEEHLQHKAGLGYDVLRDTYCLGHFTRLYGQRPLAEITRQDVERFIAQRLAEKASPRSVQREISVVKAAFYQATKWDRLEKNPAARIGVKNGHKPRERLLSVEEIDGLLRACPEDIRELVEVALLTGMRRGELLALTERDCDFVREEIAVRESKNGDPRTISMHPRVKDILWARVQGIETRRVFDIGLGRLRSAFTAALKTARLRDMRFHDLRHCAASYLCMTGADVRTVMQILGHRDPRITLRIYARVNQAHIREAVHRLHFTTRITHTLPQEAHRTPVTP